YRQAVDWISQVARVASATSKRYYIASAKSVEVHLEEVGQERTRVEFRVDPGTRGEAAVGALLGGGSGGGGAGRGTRLALGVTLVPVVVAVAGGALVAGAVARGVTDGVARAHRKKTGDIRAEIEGVLDQLELGEPLEPPPPSWREWVRRNFH